MIEELAQKAANNHADLRHFRWEDLSPHMRDRLLRDAEIWLRYPETMWPHYMWFANLV